MAMSGHCHVLTVFNFDTHWIRSSVDLKTGVRLWRKKNLVNLPRTELLPSACHRTG
jgi:hypothetical protein